MNLGPHADFIVVSYAVTILVMALLVAWVVFDYSAQRRLLGDLEQRGVRRRSQRAGNENL
jgi:heme exporter protein D